MRLLLAAWFVLSLALADRAAAQQSPADLDCGFEGITVHLSEYIAEVRSNGRTHPSTRMPSFVRPRNPSSDAAAPGVVTPADMFLFEDSANLLATSYDVDDLIDLMVDGANALLVENGDNFDFVGFWVSEDPSSTIGAAFYNLIENDVAGIGDIGSLIGEAPLFNLRPDIGLAGSEIEGFVMMWWIDFPLWATGGGSSADITRLVLAQEYEHRYALFLPPLLDGRSMQGDDLICGRSSHWNWQIDGQGSGMEVTEWFGSSPAEPDVFGINFNSDILDGVFSYTDLYLMGYVTPAEMDAGNSELRFMDGSDCSSGHFGTISTFDSSDIIASAGPRVPDVAGEDKDYRTGWVVIHPPGSPPSAAQLVKTAAILNQHTLDWSTSTLGLGTMDHTLPNVGLFQNLGNGLGGIFGVPVLVGGGTLVSGDPVSLTISKAAANAPVGLVVGLSTITAPFKGGIMVPNPDVIIVGLSTDADGVRNDVFTWPQGVPSMTSVFTQYWITDAAGPSGFSATNGLAMRTP